MQEQLWQRLAAREVMVVDLTGGDFQEAIYRTRKRISEDAQPLRDAGRGWFVEHPRFIKPIDGPYATLEAALAGAISALVTYIDFQYAYGLFRPPWNVPLRHVAAEMHQPAPRGATSHATERVTVVELGGVAFQEAVEQVGNELTTDSQPVVNAGRGWFVAHHRYIPGGDGAFVTYDAALVGAISDLVDYITYHDRFYDRSEYPTHRGMLAEAQAAERAAWRAMGVTVDDTFRF